MADEENKKSENNNNKLYIYIGVAAVAVVVLYLWNDRSSKDRRNVTRAQIYGPGYL